MADFALIHGSMCGSWCWRDLVPELERRGHRCAAPDLPCDDVDAGLAEYAAAVEAAMSAAGMDGEVVLVGHSLGCRTIPVVAARRRRARMVFLCSIPTGPGPVDAEWFASLVTPEYVTAELDERADGARRMREGSARQVFFDDCGDEVSAWAARQLRWQGPRPLLEALPIEAWPEAPVDVILTTDDRTVRLDRARAEASSWLGREPVLLPGSHSPFFSRPVALADVLERCLRPSATSS